MLVQKVEDHMRKKRVIFVEADDDCVVAHEE
jgi:hypothetical protein